MDHHPRPPVSHRALLLLAPILLSTGVPSFVHAYEVDTHRAIANVALRRAGCLVDDYLKDELVLPDGIDTPVGSVTLADRLEEGAEHEDDTSGPVRPRNHFFNPINHQGLSDIFSGTSSLLWAYNHADNQFDWQAAREAYHRSFTSGTEAQRNTELGNTFYALGHVIHLVQDLAQPQHTRNDAHITYFPGAPYEDYCHTNYGTAGAVSGLGLVGIPSFSGATSVFAGIPGAFAGYWDTGQYTGQAGFTVFGSAPGLAEYSNAYFITDDTMFGTFRMGFLRRTGLPGLRVRLTESFGNNSTAARHAFPHPSLLNTDLASFYGAGTNQVTLQREGEDLANQLHQVSLVVRDAGGAVVHSMPNLFHINNNEEIGFNNTNYQTWAENLIPRAVAYSTGVMNFFFRGRMEIAVRWMDAAQQYRITITNRSGQTMGAGTWQLYQDDASEARSSIGATFNYPGTLADGASFTADFAATAREGSYALVFRGTLGDEPELAVMAKEFEIVRVHITWDPRSDQDLWMWGPDGSVIFWDNLVTQHGELDNDNIGGLGPENITLKDLQPGTYQFMINYYRDWWTEQFYDSGTMSCMDYPMPINSPDDPGFDPCFVQTPIQVTVRTYHNSSSPVRTETRTLNYPNYADFVPGPGNPEGAVGDSWYITQIVTVDQDRNVTIGGTAPFAATPVGATGGPVIEDWVPARKLEGRQP